MPRQLMRRIGGDPPDLDVERVGALGLAAVDDGPLLDRIAGLCDVFVAVDKRLPKQQRLEGRPFGTVLLRARTPAAVRPRRTWGRDSSSWSPPNDALKLSRGGLGRPGWRHRTLPTCRPKSCS